MNAWVGGGISKSQNDRLAMERGREGQANSSTVQRPNRERDKANSEAANDTTNELREPDCASRPFHVRAPLRIS